MKTNRPFLAKITDPEVLLTAWQRIKTKRSQGGIDHVTVEDFAANTERELERLRFELITEKYIPEPLRVITIPKTKDSTQTRQIGLASVRDKVAQEAVRLVIEPILEQLFLNCSYAYRHGKGTQRAVKRVSHYINSLHYHWIVTADIDNFFSSINQETLTGQLRRAIPEESIIRLINLWLKMGTIDFRGRWNNVFAGIHLGNTLSPLLSNLYLHEFDKMMIEKDFALVRYADDMVVPCRSRREAEAAISQIKDYLLVKLDLKLNFNPIPVTGIENGFNFLGIHFQGYQRLIENSRYDRLRRKLNDLKEFDRLEGFQENLREYNETVVGWRRYYGNLIARTEIEKADEIFKEQLAEIVSAAYRQKLFKTQTEAETALENVEFLKIQDMPERKHSLHSAIQKGYSLASEAKQAVAVVNRQIHKRKQKFYRQTAYVSNLIINTPGSFIGKSGQRLIVKQERRIVREIPTRDLASITLAAHGISFSSDLISHCAENNIPLIFSSPHGRLEAILTAPNAPNSDIGLLQLKALAEQKPAFEIARSFVRGKIKNQINLMKYFHKYRKKVDTEFSQHFSEYLASAGHSLVELKKPVCGESLEIARQSLFGIEGSAAREYWNLFGLLLKNRAEFNGRFRQGATDLVNSMLNYGYAILQSRVYLAIMRVGLVPQISFLHTPQKGKPTLAFDIIEEFRPSIVDRAVLAMFSRRQHASVDDDGNLTQETRRNLIANIQTRLSTIIRFRKKELKIDEIIFHQTQSLVRHLQTQNRYKPFIEKW